MLNCVKKVVDLAALCVPKVFNLRKRREDAEVRHAIATGDKEKVNAAFQKLLKMVVLCGSLLTLTGCGPKYTVVVADREMIPIVYSGVEGWFVPKAVMLEMYDKLSEE